MEIEFVVWGASRNIWIWGRVGVREIGRGGEGGRELPHGIALVEDFLKRAVPHNAMEPLDRGRDRLNSDVEKIGVPQRAQARPLLLLLSPGIEVGVANDSCKRALVDIGSIVSWPPWMAESTERRDNQFSDGARSKRTVGSLKTSKEIRITYTGGSR